MISEQLQRLTQLVEPPNNPVHSEGNWIEVENTLGMSLPSEYKQFIEIYGQGVFMGNRKRSGVRIDSFLRPVSADLLAKSAGAYFYGRTDIEYDIYPNNPGLLGIGSYADVNVIAWHTVGGANEWNIVYIDAETGTYELERFAIDALIVSFLELTFLRETGLFSGNSMEGPHTFRPEP